MRDLLTGLLVASGNDAAITLADGRRRQPGRLRRDDERPGAGARPRPHRLRQPPRPGRPGPPLERGATSWRWPGWPCATRSSGSSWPAGGPASRARAAWAAAYLESENELLDIDPEADGVKTGMTDGAGYALVAHARQAVARGRALPRLDRLAQLGGPRPRRPDACSTDGVRPLRPGPPARRRARRSAARRCTAVPGRTIAVPAGLGARRPAAPRGAGVTETIVAPRRGDGARRARGRSWGPSPPPGRPTSSGAATWWRPSRPASPGLWDRLRAGLEALIP